MKASRAEIKIAEIFDMKDVNYIEEYEFPDLKTPAGKPLRFDFAVFDDSGRLSFLLEYQGKQHYQAVSKFGGAAGLSQQKFNDNLKRRYCALHKILLIEIPYTEEHKISYDYIMKKAGY